MLARSIFAFAALCGAIAGAQADEVSAPPLPSLALDPGAGAPGSEQQQPSPWAGLTVGTDVFAISGSGHSGGFGGDGFAGYNHEFANNVIVGVVASAGYSPTMFKYAPAKGLDFASTDVKVGYDMGRFQPYLIAGVTLVKPTSLNHNGFTSTSDSVNDLFDGSNLKAFGRVGAGFNYAISNNVSMGMEVSVSNGRGGLLGGDSGFLAPGFVGPGPLGH